MISLCSGCIHYFNFNCDKPMDQKSLVRVCDHFHFVATKSFKKPQSLYNALLEKPVVGPTTFN